MWDSRGWVRVLEGKWEPPRSSCREKRDFRTPERLVAIEFVPASSQPLTQLRVQRHPASSSVIQPQQRGSDGMRSLRQSLRHPSGPCPDKLLAAVYDLAAARGGATPHEKGRHDHIDRGAGLPTTLCCVVCQSLSFPPLLPATDPTSSSDVMVVMIILQGAGDAGLRVNPPCFDRLWSTNQPPPMHCAW